MALTDAAYDAALNVIADNADAIDICTADPGLTWASISGVSVCTIAATVGDGNGDYVLDDGAVSGRELNVTQQSGTGSATGAGNFVVFHNGTDTTYMTEAGDGDTVNNGSPVTISAHVALTFPDAT